MPEQTGTKSPSWYLDPLVAAQKKEVHQRWIRRAAGGEASGRVLKTDLFEEAHGPDQILFDLFPNAPSTTGIDLEPETARRAFRRGEHAVRCLAADVLRLPFREQCFDVVVSTSTLDHLRSEAELELAINELARVLKPGGLLLLTLDNPLNPMYPLLRLLSRARWAPFRLGHTLTRQQLQAKLRKAGLQTLAVDGLIHNPRIISTCLFLFLRWLLGGAADTPIRLLLSMFEAGRRLPTRWMSCCFVAASARKPDTSNRLS
jgi:SAM-dependent methyltransferase